MTKEKHPALKATIGRADDVKGDHAMLTMEGGCHCGRVRFRVTADLAVIDCNCSICIKKGILHLIVPPERFKLISGKDDLTTYEFNTKTAKHTFCKHCVFIPSTCRARTPARSTSTPAASTISTSPSSRRRRSTGKTGRRRPSSARPGDECTRWRKSPGRHHMSARVIGARSKLRRREQREAKS